MEMSESGVIREETKKCFVSDIVKKIPLIPVEAMAGFGAGSVQVMDYVQKHITYQNLQN